MVKAVINAKIFKDSEYVLSPLFDSVIDSASRPQELLEKMLKLEIKIILMKNTKLFHSLTFFKNLLSVEVLFFKLV